MISNILWVLVSPFVLLFYEKPSDAPQTAHLIELLKGSNKIDSLKVFEYFPKELQRAGENSGATERIIEFAKSKSEIRKITKPILAALIYPPDDISLCTNVVGYLVLYRRTISDTIFIDDGAKYLRHQIDGVQKYSYYEGDVWGTLTSNKVKTKGCNEGAN